MAMAGRSRPIRTPITEITTSTGLDAVTGREVMYGDFDGDNDLDVYVGVYRDGRPPFDPPYQSHVYLQGSDGRFALVDSPMEPAFNADKGLCMARYSVAMPNS